ncbi:MAG: transcription termination/antitermination factor NusG [Clostridia bacterium]|nr:transcription termination/antitermination factor NusG [Clostridia bacterium]
MEENTNNLTKNGSTDELNWYVVYTYSGYENKVKATLEKYIENTGLKDKIKDIIIPMEEEIEIKDGKQKTSIKKVFPGYILVKMIMTDETWYAVKHIKGVFSFVGVGEKPMPLTEEEMKSLGIEDVISLDYEVGDNVRIITDPFYNYPAVIEKIIKEKRRVVVTVDMFGRKTTVDLEFDQVQKM